MFYAIITVEFLNKDGLIRIWVFYRDFIATTKKEPFLLSRIKQVLLTLFRASYFVSLDLLISLHQVEVDPCGEAKIDFLTYQSLYV